MIKRRIDGPWFFIADTHFEDPGVLRRAGMDYLAAAILGRTENMIRAWNEVVPPDGVVMHAGDVSLHCTTRRLREILERLNGTILLAEGSHDETALQCRDRFGAICDTFMLYHKAINTHIFVAHHCHKVWPLSHYGSWHIHGHSHGGLNDYAAREGKIVDAYSPQPIPLSRIEEIMATRPENFNSIRRRRLQ